MKLAVMQPYFLPYLGYFQLLHAVDQFVIYDNIEFSKRGWVQRNRILVNGAPAFISLPLKKDSDYLDICQRSLADTFPAEQAKLLGKIDSTYRRAPFHAITMELVRECFECRDSNLFDFIHGSVRAICRHLDIKTPITISSTLDVSNMWSRPRVAFAARRVATSARPSMKSRTPPTQASSRLSRVSSSRQPALPTRRPSSTA